MTDDILFETHGRIGLITLNRPKALNALTHDMAKRLDAKLVEWAEDDAVAAVVIRGAGEKGFCAGGDLRAFMENGLEHGARNYAFYADEYRMNARIKRFPKPYVAIMDGIVMGGGVGVSVHGSHRVAGDRTLFAMPETGIGLFPDVGGTWFLPRLPGETGMWLALTGARLKTADAIAAGVCDLYVPSERREAALEALVAANFEADLPASAVVDSALAPFAEPAEGATLPPLRPAIDFCFRGDSVEAVLDALAAEDTDWSRAQRATLLTKSPSSLRITFRQMREGRSLEFEDAMRLEYRLARWCVTHPDLYEGIRAVIVDKDNAPRWRPATLAEADDAHVAAAFAPLSEREELALPATPAG